MDRFPEYAAFLERNRHKGETLIDCSKRILVVRALSECRTQVDAAKSLSCSPRMITYYKHWLKSTHGYKHD